MRGNDFKLAHIYRTPATSDLENGLVLEFAEKYNRGNFKLFIAESDLLYLKSIMNTAPLLPVRDWEMYIEHDTNKLDKVGDFDEETRQ